jgi:NADH:ubiquinone oxidoreductase subunit F (NADH-binding)
VGGRPTLVQNVETLAHLAQIARHGAEWFRLAGPADDPGTTLVTLGGAVRRPSILEAAVGTDMGRLVAGGGGVSSPPQALLVGGFFGAWVPADRAWGAPFSRTGLQPLGAAPGAGVVIVLPASACGLSETARVLRWYRGESAGQCGPCVHGLADIAAGTAALAAGTLPFAEVGRLRRWAGDIEGRGACRHPDGAVRLLRSALDVFAGDVLRHAHGDPCPGSRGTPVLAVPVPSDTWR